MKKYGYIDFVLRDLEKEGLRDYNALSILPSVIGLSYKEKSAFGECIIVGP